MLFIVFQDQDNPYTPKVHTVDIVVIIQAAYNQHHSNGIMHRNNKNGNHCRLYASLQRVQIIHYHNMQNIFNRIQASG
jgi:hypothetical protein